MTLHLSHQQLLSGNDQVALYKLKNVDFMRFR